MNNKIEKSGLALGIIILCVLIVLGIWWFAQMSSQNNGSVTTNTNGTSTTASGNHPVATDIDSNMSVSAIVSSLASGSAYASYFRNTGVSSLVTGKGPYTIFVPTNVAFSHQPTGSISGLSLAAQKRFVEYHIISGKEVSPTASFFGSNQTMSGDPVNFSNNQAGQPQVNSSFIIHAYKGTNGIVYLISEVLLPPKK